MVGKEIRILRARETTFSSGARDRRLFTLPSSRMFMAAAVCPFLSLSLLPPSLSLSLSHNVCFFGQFCDIAKVAMLQEDLARSGYKLNMKSNILKTSFYIFWLT